jgi:hypothetical protein
MRGACLCFHLGPKNTTTERTGDFGDTILDEIVESGPRDRLRLQTKLRVNSHSQDNSMRCKAVQAAQRKKSDSSFTQRVDSNGTIQTDSVFETHPVPSRLPALEAVGPVIYQGRSDVSLSSASRSSSILQLSSIKTTTRKHSVILTTEKSFTIGFFEVTNSEVLSEPVESLECKNLSIFLQ